MTRILCPLCLRRVRFWRPASVLYPQVLIGDHDAAGEPARPCLGSQLVVRDPEVLRTASRLVAGETVDGMTLGDPKR